uniref:Uncharacterized protein n=1 Tax=Cucumis melo TaxID=3656 RepID=A0A9I9EB61_CUCME
MSKLWKPDVTHVIASADENGACSQTYEVLMGILNGIWIFSNFVKSQRLYEGLQNRYVGNGFAMPDVDIYGVGRKE